MIGINEVVNVTIIDLYDDGPVIILLLKKKLLSPFQLSNEFILYQ